MSILEIIQTKKLLEASKLPTQLDVARILTVRQPHYNDYYLRNLEAGLSGEDEVLEFLQLYGKSQWKGIRNIWLNVSGKFECDFILLTYSGIHLFEIKNYNGHFVYENDDCTLNKRVLSDNPITQTKRNFRKLKSIIHKINPNINVTGTLVFIGEHNSVEINSPVSDITIVERNQFRDYIFKLVESENYQPQSINFDRIIAQLEKYEDVNYFVPEALDTPSMEKIRKGIYCASCQSFNLAISKLYINCNCGYKESRESGTLRTICEYSVLTMKGQITLGEVFDFINGQASERYLITIMKKHFRRNVKGKYTYYDINPVPLHKQVLLIS